MRRLGCAAASQYEIAEHLLVDVIREWQEQWCFGCSDGSSVMAFSQEKSKTPVGYDWYFSSSASGELWLAANWATLLFSHHTAKVPDDTVRVKLINAAQASLVLALQKAFGMSSLNVPSKGAPKGLGDPLDARLLLGFHLGGDSRLLVLLDTTLLDEFFPRVPRTLPIVPRADAIGGMKMQVQASLHFASLAVDDVNGLGVGDVLQSGVSLLRPMDLTVSSGQVVGKGFLARKSDKLAIQLFTDKD